MTKIVKTLLTDVIAALDSEIERKIGTSKRGLTEKELARERGYIDGALYVLSQIRPIVQLIPSEEVDNTSK